ncbi:MAG: CatB-related O-acetyltransferase [Kiloniellaceae bacterium]
MVMPDGTVIREVVHLNQVIDHPRIEVGAHSYYHDFQLRDDYAATIAPYLFAFSRERLVIGKFVQIAHGVRFITSSANHRMDGFSTYPFWNFMMTPQTSNDEIKSVLDTLSDKGDTVIGNDVWLGMDAMVMPGVTIGDGAIVSARAVVVKDVAPYTIVGGNPARALKQRFPQPVIEALMEIRWWDWPLDKIEANLDVIQGADLATLKALV